MNIYHDPQKELQKHFEYKYSKQNIRKRVKKELSSSEELLMHLKRCETEVQRWMDKPSYPQKEESMRFLKASDICIQELLLDVLTEALPFKGSMEMTSLCGLTAHLLPYENYMESVKRMADIIVIMAKCDLFTLQLANYAEGTSIMLYNRYGLDEDTCAYLQQVKFLPPMVCKPNHLRTNKDSPYLVHRASPFSRKVVPHNEDICLDSMNSFNSTAFSLDVEFLYQVSDELSDKDTDEDVETRQHNFERLVRATNLTAIELINSGNRFYLPNFDDSRGRKYRRGYHINPQGNSFRKAMLNFADPVAMVIPEDMKDLF